MLLTPSCVPEAQLLLICKHLGNRAKLNRFFVKFKASFFFLLGHCQYGAGTHLRSLKGCITCGAQQLYRHLHVDCCWQAILLLLTQVWHVPITFFQKFRWMYQICNKSGSINRGFPLVCFFIDTMPQFIH